MTQEGIRGNEEMPDATHNTTLPFTRYLAGAGDYTLCYFNNRVKNTKAHQLAMAAVYYSPLQFMFWYDRPEFYQGEEELEFWKAIPSVWDDSRLLSEGILLLAIVTPVALLIDYNLAHLELNSWRNGTTLEWDRLLLCAAISFVLIALMIVIGIGIPARKAMKVQPAEALHDE